MKTKTIYLILLSFLMAACDMDTTLNTNAEKVSGVASTIADFDLPAGYSPEFSASLEDYTVATFNLGDGHSHLYLIQSKKESDGKKLDNMLYQIVPGLYDQQTHMSVIETFPVTVRGQATTLVLSEGSNGEGELYRQAMVAFTGNGGPALLVYSTSLESWDIETVEALIASIR